MSNIELEPKIWELIGFIKVSPARYNCITCIGRNYKMPSEIAKQTNMRITQISNALHDLKDKDIVICLNETTIKGRLYQNTELGLKILEELENNKQ